MIVSLFVIGLMDIVAFLLSWISIPAAPLVVTNAISNVIPFFAFPIQLIKAYVGNEFFNAMLVMIIAYTIFAISYRPGHWLYNKIRGSGN